MRQAKLMGLILLIIGAFFCYISGLIKAIQTFGDSVNITGKYSDETMALL